MSIVIQLCGSTKPKAGWFFPRNIDKSTYQKKYAQIRPETYNTSPKLNTLWLDFCPLVINNRYFRIVHEYYWDVNKFLKLPLYIYFKNPPLK